MSEVIGDVVVPSELVIPLRTGSYVGGKGSLFLSGDKLWINVDGSSLEIVTSA